MNVTMMNGEERSQRAHSAPPAPAVGTGPPKTFVSSMNYQPQQQQRNSPSPKPQEQYQKPQTLQQQQQEARGKVIPIMHQAGSNSSKNSPPRPPPNQQTPPPQQQQGGSGVVRHIPIFVEGRDSPVNLQQQQSQQQKASRPSAPADDRSKCSSPNQTPPIKKPTLFQPPTPLEIIQKIYAEVQELEKQVDAAPGGPKTDHNYLSLDDMLTRKLLLLDNVETEGKEEIRTARKECIVFILSCASKLEKKYPSETPADPPCTALAVIENSSADTKMECDDDQNSTAGKTDGNCPVEMVVDNSSLANPTTGKQPESACNTVSANNVPIPLPAPAIPLPPPADQQQLPSADNQPKKSESTNKVTKMEVKLAQPNDSNTPNASN